MRVTNWIWLRLDNRLNWMVCVLNRRVTTYSLIIADRRTFPARRVRNAELNFAHVMRLDGA